MRGWLGVPSDGRWAGSWREVKFVGPWVCRVMWQPKVVTVNVWRRRFGWARPGGWVPLSVRHRVPEGRFGQFWVSVAS